MHAVPAQATSCLLQMLYRTTNNAPDAYIVHRCFETLDYSVHEMESKQVQSSTIPETLNFHLIISTTILCFFLMYLKISPDNHMHFTEFGVI